MKITWSSTVTANDVASIRKMVAGAGVFSPEEIDVAEELAQDRCKRGAKSDYHFILASTEGKLAGYTCYGRIPLTDGRFDLYWIVVGKKFARQGIASMLLERTEEAARKKGCKRLYAETSSRKIYAPAQRFYLGSGFREVARVKDFYRDGDDKVMYEKKL